MKQLLPLINATLLMLCALQINSSSAPFALQFNLQETVNNPVEKRWFISQSTEQRIIQSRFINQQLNPVDQQFDLKNRLTNGIVIVPICYDRNPGLKKSFSKLRQFCTAMLINDEEILQRLQNNDYCYQQLWPMISYLQCADDAPIVTNACNLLQKNIRLEQLLFYSIAKEFYETAYTLIQYKLSNPYWIEKFTSLRVYETEKNRPSNETTQSILSHFCQLNMGTKSQAKSTYNTYLTYAKQINISVISLAVIYGNQDILSELLETINYNFLHYETYAPIKWIFKMHYPLEKKLNIIKKLYETDYEKTNDDIAKIANLCFQYSTKTRKNYPPRS